MVVPAPAVPRDVSREHRQELDRVVGLLDERAGLRKSEKAVEGILHAVERVFGAKPLAPHDPDQACSVLVNEPSHPVEEAGAARRRALTSRPSRRCVHVHDRSTRLSPYILRHYRPSRHERLSRDSKSQIVTPA